MLQVKLSMWGWKVTLQVLPMMNILRKLGKLSAWWVSSFSEHDKESLRVSPSQVERPHQSFFCTFWDDYVLTFLCTHALEYSRRSFLAQVGVLPLLINWLKDTIRVLAPSVRISNSLTIENSERMVYTFLQLVAASGSSNSRPFYITSDSCLPGLIMCTTRQR